MKSNRNARVQSIMDRALADLEDGPSRIGPDMAQFGRRYLRPYRRGILLAAALSMVVAVQPFAMSLTSRFLVDDVLRVNRGGVDMDNIAHHVVLAWWLIAFRVGLWLAYLTAMWIRTRVVQSAGRSVVYDLRRALHEKLQSLHIGFFERMPPGKIISRILDDVRVLQNWMSSQSINLVTHVFELVFGLGLLFFLNWRLACLVTGMLPVYGYVFKVFRPAIERTHLAFRRLHSRLYGYIAERIAHVQVVQAFAQEKRETSKCAAITSDMVRVRMRLARYQQGITLAATVLASLTSAALTYLLMRQVQTGTMSMGSALAFVFALGPVFVPVNGLTSMAVEAQSVPVILRRVFAILETPVAVSPGKIDLAGMRGKIRFDHVTFAYPGNEANALEDVSFQVLPGERVAIMGPSGSGKSTIFQLLLRFYDPNSGQVRVGGVNLQEAATASIRRHVGMVQQEPVVFSGTLADNIRYGRLDATPSEIMRAAEWAELHDFIMELPMKYETDVGEQGVTLSGGQKQRMALATALLTDPEILLLDDTTSALDAETEVRIRETLHRVMERRTSLVITHRVATARAADRIIVLDKGRVVQMGVHETLAEETGFYRQTCLQQKAL